MSNLSSNPSDIFNDVEAAAVSTILADKYLGCGTTTLASDISAEVDTVPLASLAAFSGRGVVKIGDERIAYSGTSGNSLTGCARGYRGTTAAEHSSGVTVTNYNIVTVHQKVRDLKVERAYYQYELPALAVFADKMETAIGETFGEWDLPVGLHLEIVDIVGDLTQVGDLQTGLSELGRLMRYQNEAESGNLDGVADAIRTLGAEIFCEKLNQGAYLIKGIGRCTVMVITTE